MSAHNDAARIEWLHHAILGTDPTCQLVKLTEGPAPGDVTMHIYNGRETVEYASNHLSNVLDAAMKEGAS